MKISKGLSKFRFSGIQEKPLENQRHRSIVELNRMAHESPADGLNRN